MFGPHGVRQSATSQLLDILLSNGIEREPGREAIKIAVNDGPQNIDVIRRLTTIDYSLLRPAFQDAASLSDLQHKLPIMEYLLKRGKGHALTHEYHH